MRVFVLALSALTFAAVVPRYGWPRAADEDPIATFTEVEGDVAIIRASGGEEILAEIDTELGEGDEIAVPEGAAATISFLDDHLLNLSERTTMTVRTMKPRSSSGGFWGRMWLKAGGVVASLSRLSDSDAGFEIETATAVAAVKGTTFAVEFDGDTSTVSVLSGNVETAGRSSGGARLGQITLGEGQETSIDPGSRRPKTPRGLALKGRRSAVRERMRALKAVAKRHREMKKSGELRTLRKLRHLARNGQLRQADPKLRRYLGKHPDLKEKLRRHAERHERIKNSRRAAPEKRIKRAPKKTAIPAQRKAPKPRGSRKR